MPPPKQKAIDDAAARLARVAPPVSRWIERLLAAHDPPLTLAQHVTLQAVAEGDASGTELARRASVSAAAASQLVTALEQRGFVERAAIEGDRRRHSLTLTATGRATLQSADHTLRNELAGLIADLPGPEANAMSHSLRLLELLLSGKTPPRRPPRPAGPRHPPGKHH